MESEFPTATQAENQRGREKSRNNRGDRGSEGRRGADAEFMWFRVALWHLDVIHFTLSRGIHLPPSSNYGALFPLLIHLNVCLCLFLVTIRAHTYRCTHTHVCATKPLSSVINPSLLAVVVFLFPLCCVLAVGAVFPRSALLALCCGNTTWSLLHPTTLGHREGETEGNTDSN